MILTNDSKALFAEIIEDAPNWNGTPLINGNIEIGSDRRGNLSDLVKKGLVKVFKDDGENWIEILPAGEELAEEYGF